MKVAVVGAGSMGGRHAELLGELAGIDEVLVVDADAARADAVATRVGGRALALDDALAVAGAVVVANPAEHHASSVEAAVACGLPVLCEKPLTDRLGSTVALVRLVEETGARVQVGFHRRHDPAFAAGKRRVAGGVGLVHLLRLTAFDPHDAPRPAAGPPDADAARMFLHSSIHDFDLVRWMSGQEVVEVSTEGSDERGARPADPEEIVTSVVSMRLSDGTLAILEATWLHPGGYDNRVELVAEDAHLSMGFTPRTPATPLEGQTAVEVRPWRGYLDRFDDAYRAELAAFVAWSRGTGPPACSTRDGLEALRVAIAATRSFVERRPVRLEEIPGLAPRDVG